MNRKDFIIDVFTILSLANFWAFELLYFVKFMQVKRVLERVEEHIILKETFHRLYQLLMLMIRTLFLTHYFSCIWLWIGFK